MPPISRLFVALSLLALVLTHALALPAIRLRFEWRRAEIARTLCETRLRPELGCQGSCVLRAELQAAADHTDGLLRLGAHALADPFVPAAPLTWAFAAALPAWVAAPAWPRARESRAADGFAGSLLRPPAMSS